jgi:hypothetical protein
MDIDGINNTRIMRARFYSAVEFFINNNTALLNAGDELEWDDLVNLPNWYLWDDEAFQQLVLVAGTVFLLPTIRLWIEAKKINIIQSLVGKSIYEFIMKYTNIDSSPKQQLELDNLQDVINSAGASVILSSQVKRLHPWLIIKLPKAKGHIDRKLASELLNHTLYVLEYTGVKSIKQQELNDTELNNSGIE